MTSPFVHLDEDLIAYDIKLFLNLTLYVKGLTVRGVTGEVAVQPGKLTKSNGFRDGLAGHGDIKNKGIEFATGVWKATSFLNEELRQRTIHYRAKFHCKSPLIT